tara:strand:+ start:2548 stop:3279 length:732 start_codon:yes stop_codon:yes gene_type:complete
MRKIQTIYSVKFTPYKRKNSKINYLLLHYTGMKSEESAIKRLTLSKSKVSCHYFIKNNGQIIQMVPDNYISWHAGNSSWKNKKMLNKISIGIEIQNPGHKFGYKNFKEIQIASLKYLLKKLINKFNIKRENILGHSDVSPNRKKDPGEKFPWKKLSENKIGVWHNLDDIFLKRLRNKRIKKAQKILFLKFIRKIGYNYDYHKKGSVNHAVIAFQRRFRPEAITPKIDLEVLEIAKNLVENKLY